MLMPGRYTLIFTSQREVVTDFLNEVDHRWQVRSQDLSLRMHHSELAIICFKLLVQFWIEFLTVFRLRAEHEVTCDRLVPI